MDDRCGVRRTWAERGVTLAAASDQNGKKPECAENARTDFMPSLFGCEQTTH